MGACSLFTNRFFKEEENNGFGMIRNFATFSGRWVVWSGVGKEVGGYIGC